MNRQEKIDKLKANGVTVADGVSDAVLDTLMKSFEDGTPPATTNTGTSAPAAPAVVVGNSQPTLSDYLNGLPQDVREMVVNSITRENQRKAALVEQLFANADVAKLYPKEVLAQKPIDELEKLGTLVLKPVSAPVVDFSMMGLPVDPLKANEVKPLELPTLNFAKV